jgi:DedD protein
MATDSPQPAVPSQDLRRRISIRLSIALILLVGVTITWRVLDHTAPSAETPNPGSAQQDAGGTLGQPTNSAATSRPVAAVVQSQEPEVAEAQIKAPDSAEQAKVAAVEQEPAQSAKSTTDSPTPVTEVGDNNDQGGVVASPEVASAAAPPPKLPHGPYLQVGVFTHPANATKLKAALEAQGIPVYLATRVQVGPFKNKKEADLMRKKLEAMGISSLLIRQ